MHFRDLRDHGLGDWWASIGTCSIMARCERGCPYCSSTEGQLNLFLARSPEYLSRRSSSIFSMMFLHRAQYFRGILSLTHCKRIVCSMPHLGHLHVSSSQCSGGPYTPTSHLLLRSAALNEAKIGQSQPHRPVGAEWVGLVQWINQDDGHNQ